jgi:hypothetical protein
MKKIAPGIGNQAKKYRKPSETLSGGGRKIKKRKSKRLKRKKNGRKRNKQKSKKN